MWRNIRIAILLIVLLWAAVHTSFERYGSTRWKDPLWVGIFPVNADGTTTAQSYVDGIDIGDFADIGDFMAREAHRYGKSLAEPVHIVVYPQVRKPPPELPRDAGVLGTVWWSLKLRWYASRNADTHGRAPPHVRMFVLFHDPSTLQTVPDSHGMQKGLIGVTHAFASKQMARTNNVVVTHELLHTLGATDKYDYSTGVPLFPIGFADPSRKPLYPQDQAEIMAGRRAVSTQSAEMPEGLNTVVVGPATALEIRWASH
ncbi:MAG: hypothetical protein JSR66_32050 [Proteobacteria bacterium]|nr:hypothetical protein [Pseudomonadota bacterium]